MSQTDRCSPLRQVSPFSLLTDANFAGLAREARYAQHAPSAMILSRESTGAICLLVSGRAEAVIEDVQGRAMTLTIIEKDELFGNIGLSDERTQPTSVLALEACETLCVPHAAFVRAIEGNYEAAMVILALSEARLKKAHMKIATLGLLDVHARVARVLVESARQVNGEWIVACGSEQIARTVAASREMVSRVVKSMNARGLVRRDRKKTVILDWPSMSAASQL